jgi:hypothetical protein
LFDSRVAATAQLADTPLFSRLQHYFGVSPRSQAEEFDSDPWRSCGGLDKVRLDRSVGTVATSQLYFSRMPVSVAFTNVFTGSGQNWWSNVKLAEAYARLATNRPVNARFCEDPPPSDNLFQDTERHGEIVAILSQQRSVSWVNTPDINRWERLSNGQNTAISKTGTTLRADKNNSTAVFALVAGRVASRRVADGRPASISNGIAIAAHIDDIGMSTRATQLVNSVFHLLEPRFEEVHP